MRLRDWALVEVLAGRMMKERCWKWRWALDERLVEEREGLWVREH